MINKCIKILHLSPFVDSRKPLLEDDVLLLCCEYLQFSFTSKINKLDIPINFQLYKVDIQRNLNVFDHYIKILFFHPLVIKVSREEKKVLRNVNKI